MKTKKHPDTVRLNSKEPQMGSKLTDEIVARKLGWKHIKNSFGNMIWSPDGIYGINNSMPKNAPKFTTDLNTIVAEIEARGLKFDLFWGDGEWNVYLFNPKIKGHVTETATAKTAALALCAALIEHIGRGK